MRILIIPDKFKGTLTACQAAQAIARGWRRVRPQDELEQLPMSDGGDGFGGVMSGLLGAKPRSVDTVDAAHRACRARWWWDATTRTAIVESAQVIGLAKLPHNRFHPFDLDTFGLGKVLTAVTQKGPIRCIIGIGGSATNDGGFGMARAFGWRFLSQAGDDILRWSNLIHCSKIVPPTRPLQLGRVVVALDVQNPLLGANGCTRVYGSQKGLKGADFKLAEQALQGMAAVVSKLRGKVLADRPGAGAAGGLGFGLMAFLNARPKSGFSLFGHVARLQKRLRAADLAITGEGYLDKQSLMGKGVGELLTLCETLGVPCLAISGRTELPRSAQGRFMHTYSVTSLTTQRQGAARPGLWLAKAAGEAAAELLS